MSKKTLGRGITPSPNPSPVDRGTPSTYNPSPLLGAFGASFLALP